MDFSNELWQLSELILENASLQSIGPKIPNWSISIDPVFEKCFFLWSQFQNSPNFINGFSNKQVREKMNKLSKWTKLAYGLGHVHNDIAATICFSFSLLYMQVCGTVQPSVVTDRQSNSY